MANGTGGGFANLLQSKMLLQYLSGAGAALSAGEPISPALNQITQGNISAQNQATTNQKTMQMLAQMLSGNLVPGASMKMSDKGDLSMSLPGSIVGGNRIMSSYNTTTNQQQPQNQNNLLNPFL